MPSVLGASASPLVQWVWWTPPGGRGRTRALSRHSVDPVLGEAKSGRSGRLPAHPCPEEEPGLGPELECPDGPPNSGATCCSLIFSEMLEPRGRAPRGPARAPGRAGPTQNTALSCGPTVGRKEPPCSPPLSNTSRDMTHACLGSPTSSFPAQECGPGEMGGRWLQAGTCSSRAAQPQKCRATP